MNFEEEGKGEGIMRNKGRGKRGRGEEVGIKRLVGNLRVSYYTSLKPFIHEFKEGGRRGL